MPWCHRVGLKSTKILAKIESLAALSNFAEILAVADGIIFSRGLIGLDIALEKVFRVQKYVIDVRNDVTCLLLSTRAVVGVHPCLQTCRCHTCDGYNDGDPSSHKSRGYRHCKSRTRRRRLPSSGS